MDTEIDSLVIEVTRRCNMSCHHCLRGDAENMDMNLDYVRSLFSKIDTVNTLTITGGEPSLVPQIINKIIDISNEENVYVGRFYLVTNAKKITMEFITVLLRLYTEWVNYYEDEIPLVQWSNDYYHDDVDKEGIRLLKGLSFATPKYYKDDTEYRCIDEGNASINIGDCRENTMEEIEVECGSITQGCIYLNCKGQIINDCNWSYESQDDEDHECRICSVDEFSVKKVLVYANNQDGYTNRIEELITN